MPAYKRDLTLAVSETLGTTEAQAAKITNAVLQAIAKITDEHGSLTLRDFGHFYSHTSKPTTCRTSGATRPGSSPPTRAATSSSVTSTAKSTGWRRDLADLHHP